MKRSSDLAGAWHTWTIISFRGPRVYRQPAPVVLVFDGGELDTALAWLMVTLHTLRGYDRGFGTIYNWNSCRRYNIILLIFLSS